MVRKHLDKRSVFTFFLRFLTVVKVFDHCQRKRKKTTLAMGRKHLDKRSVFTFFLRFLTIVKVFDHCQRKKHYVGNGAQAP
jgi:hypothetical protein